MLATKLTDQQRAEFVDAFYSIDGNPLKGDNDDRHTSAPFGCPWYHWPDVHLHGDTPQEMAGNYYKRMKKEIEFALDYELPLKRINSLEKLRNYVSTCMDSVDMSCYTLDHEELIDAVTDKLLAHLRAEYFFEWGDMLPHIEEQIFWGFFEEFEK